MENQENKIMEENNNQEIENTKSEKKLSFFEKVITFIKKDKKRSIIIGCAIVVVIVLGTVIGVLSNSSSDYENDYDSDNEDDYSYYDSDEDDEEEEISVRDFIPTPKEYTEKLIDVFPDISDWKLAHDADTSTIYTDTGSTTNFQDAIVINDDAVTLFIYNKSLQVIAKSTEDSDLPALYVYDKNSSHLDEVFDSVDAFLEDYPKALDMDEFEELLEENGKISSGQKEYETTVNGITYKISRSNSSGPTMLWIFL